MSTNKLLQPERTIMDRKVFAQQEDITLLFAEEPDRRMIYDMAFEEPGIWRSFAETRDEFPWSVVEDEDPCFFGREPGKSKYLLIHYQGKIIGTISYAHNDGRTENFELDIWLRSESYTGKGIGSSTMKLLIRTLVVRHGVKTFIIRPWSKNPRAIKAYEKCGFLEKKDFRPEEYYGSNLDLYGPGDHEPGENCNMVLEFS